MPRAQAPQEEKPGQGEARTLQKRVVPLAVTRESLPAATKTQRSQNSINKSLKKKKERKEVPGLHKALFK